MGFSTRFLGRALAAPVALAAALMVGAAPGLAPAAAEEAAPAAAATPSAVDGLASHRAVYELKLVNATERSGLSGVDGRLVYEFAGSTCEGFTSQFRFVTRFVNSEGKVRLSDLRTTTFEDGDGKTLDFLNQNYVDGRLAEETKGVAKRGDAATTAEITKPARNTVSVPLAALFPTRHMVTLIEAAKAGKTITDIGLYDGSENGQRVYETTVVIGREATGPDTFGEEAGADSPLLKDKRRWPVTISYFDAKKKVDDGTPEYQLSFLIYENGISRRMRLDYGDFSLAGRLSDLTAVDAKACK